MAIEPRAGLAPDSKTEFENESYYIASSSQLIWRSFVKHKPAMVAAIVLFILYLTGPLFAEFFSTTDIYLRHTSFVDAPPSRIRFFHQGSLRAPFVYGMKGTRDPETLRRIYEPDKDTLYPIRFFVHGTEYELWGLFKSDLHFIGTLEPGNLFLFGTDDLGRDMFSRTLHGARVSLTLGLLGVAISFVLGCLLGGISGYYGGSADMLIQRVIEFLGGIPTLPFWMALAAAIPKIWPPIRTYFMMTIILSIIGWTGLARIVRGKLLAIREEDYVMAAKISGSTELRIITRHLLPGFLSYLIVHLSLAVPGMILGETALSFLGIGLTAPVVSWGVQLQGTQNVSAIAMKPWLLIPALFIVVTVLSFNFLGDGLRDAADP